MTLSVFIDIKALHYAGKYTRVWLVENLRRDLEQRFPGIDLEFNFFAHSDALGIVTHEEVYLFSELEDLIQVAPNHWEDPKLIWDFDDLFISLDEWDGDMPPLIVTVNPENFEEYEDSIFLLKAAAFGSLEAQGERNFDELVASSYGKKVKVYMDTDDTVLDRKRCCVRGTCALNETFFDELGKFSNESDYQQISSRSLPIPEVARSAGEHEALYDISEHMSADEIKARRFANAVRMEEVLKNVSAQLSSMGFREGCYSSTAIYTSNLCLKLEAIYQDLRDSDYKVVFLFDDDYSQLNRSIPEVDEVCRKIEALGIEVHLVLACSAGAYAQADFDLVCQEIVEVDSSLEESPAFGRC